MKNVKKLFKCNTEVTEIAEWCIAQSKTEAYDFLDKFWDDGDVMENMYVNPYFEANPGKTLDDFIEFFFLEECPESDFTHPYGGVNDEPVTKKVSDWLDEADIVPCYLCHEKW